MAVLNALRETPGALRRNPVVLVPVLILALLQLPQLLLQWVNPLLSSLVSLLLSLVMIVVIPFFQGGLIGLSNEALDGPTTLERFKQDGIDNFVSLLGAYLALFVINTVLGVVAFVPIVIIGVVLLGEVPIGGLGLAALAVVGIIAAIAVLAYLLITFFLQFYGHAIVLDDLGAIGGLKRSAVRVRHNLLSVLGYSVLIGLFGGLVGLVSGGASWLATPGTSSLLGLPEPSLALVGVLGLLYTAVLTVAGGFFAIYSVAFYRTLSLPTPP